LKLPEFKILTLNDWNHKKYSFVEDLRE